MNQLKSPKMAKLHHEWQSTPEPISSRTDPQTILDTDEASYDAYMWSSVDCSEQWLAYDGPLAVVQE